MYGTEIYNSELPCNVHDKVLPLRSLVGTALAVVFGSTVWNFGSPEVRIMGVQ